MDLPTFVAEKFKTTLPLRKIEPFATGLLAVDAVRVSALIEQWRTISNTVLPLTYAEFCAVLAGDLLPSDSILRAWQRLPFNRHRPATLESPELKDYLSARRDDLLAIKSIQYETEARRILTRFAGTPATTRLYALYLAFAGRHARQAFFRRWAMPFPEGSSVAHGFIAAGTGQGKSELIKALVFERVRRNEGVVVFDPHGDMVQQIARWPEVARSGKLVYLDPYLAGPDAMLTPVINPMDAIKTNPYQEAAVGYLVEALKRLVGEAELSLRMMTLLRTILPALSKQPHASLRDIRAIMGNPKKPEIKAMLESLAINAEDNSDNADFIRNDLKEGNGDYNNTRTAIRGRLQYLFASIAFRRCVTGPSTINLREQIDRGAIILVDLSGNMGPGVAADWGKLLIASLFSAAMSRQNLERHQRRDCFAYIDEADAFLNESIEDIYAKTRKYGLFLAVAQQTPGANMSANMQRQVLGNAGIRIAGFTGDPTSAEYLAKITGAPVEAVTDLRKGEFLFHVPPTLHRASVRRDLRDFAHSISKEEWEQVKADQFRRYYRDHSAFDAGQSGALDGLIHEVEQAILIENRKTDY